MRKLFKIIYLVFIIVVPYLIIIYMFPSVWAKIDEVTWTQFNSNTIKQVDIFFGKVSDTKDSTNSFIDWVWKNTKNKKAEQKNNIDEIINQ